MKNLVIVAAACSSLALGGCATQGGVIGGVAGATIGGVATGTVGGALVGAGVGAVAGTVVQAHATNGLCTYRAANGQYYRARCPY